MTKTKQNAPKPQQQQKKKSVVLKRPRNKQPKQSKEERKVVEYQHSAAHNFGFVPSHPPLPPMSKWAKIGALQMLYPWTSNTCQPWCDDATADRQQFTTNETLSIPLDGVGAVPAFALFADMAVSFRPYGTPAYGAHGTLLDTVGPDQAILAQTYATVRCIGMSVTIVETGNNSGKAGQIVIFPLRNWQTQVVTPGLPANFAATINKRDADVRPLGSSMRFRCVPEGKDGMVFAKPTVARPSPNLWGCLVNTTGVSLGSVLLVKVRRKWEGITALNQQGAASSRAAGDMEIALSEATSYTKYPLIDAFRSHVQSGVGAGN